MRNLYYLLEKIVKINKKALFNWPSPTSFSFFCLFKQALQFLQQINVKNVSTCKISTIHQTISFQAQKFFFRNLRRIFVKFCEKFKISQQRQNKKNLPRMKYFDSRKKFLLFWIVDVPTSKFCRCLEKCIRWWDSSPWPLKYESPSLTTRPGRPFLAFDFFQVFLRPYNEVNNKSSAAANVAAWEPKTFCKKIWKKLNRLFWR